MDIVMPANQLAAVAGPENLRLPEAKQLGSDVDFGL